MLAMFSMYKIIASNSVIWSIEVLLAIQYNKTIEKEQNTDRIKKGSKTMSTNEVMKMVTDAMKSNGATADQIAKMEIAIQYIGNPDFREKLNEFVFNANYHK